MNWTVSLEAAADESVREAILKPLLAHMDSNLGDGGRTPLVITVRDESGEIAGGLWGNTWHNFLFVELLAMGAAKGEGIGRRVMQLAEEEARRRGCAGIWLDTFTFQAPWFYPKLGFTEFGRITGYPPGHDRIFLMKRLDS